jgi:hypothetical protein
MPRVSKARVQAAKDEELDSEGEMGEMGGDIDDMDFQRGRGPITLDDDEFVDANETAAEKRVRLARGYLDKVAADVAEGESVVPCCGGRERMERWKIVTQPLLSTIPFSVLSSPACAKAEADIPQSVPRASLTPPISTASSLRRV